MKRIISYILLILIIISLFFIIFRKKETGNTKLRVAEVAHSVFYAPFYVALEQGYFTEQGIDIELILTPGADKVAASVLSNDVEIGFAGPEATIYVYQGNENDYLKTFAGLTKRDGQFIVGRKEDNNFKLEDLKGKEVIVGRKGGMPAINFLNALNNSGINESEVKINYSIEFAGLSGAFISGIGDYVNLFEPNATKLYEQKLGYVLASIGELSDEMPYTAFFARNSYINNNKETINKFRKAINKGLEYVKNNSASNIANKVIGMFPDTSVNEMVNIIDNYKKHDSWLNNIYVSEKSFNNLQELLKKYNLINEYVEFNKLVINE